MLRAGLTGGAGSGKSTVARMLAERGFPVVDADRVAHELYAPGTALARAILARFGPETARPDGSIDRAILGRLVFEDPERLRALNGLVHPPLVAELRSRLDALAGSGATAAVLEAALLLQWSAPGLVDLVIGVWAPREARLKRLVAGGLALEAAVLRVDAQIPDDVLRRRADFIVENTGSLDVLRTSIDGLAGELRRHAAAP